MVNIKHHFRIVGIAFLAILLFPSLCSAQETDEEERLLFTIWVTEQNDSVLKNNQFRKEIVAKIHRSSTDSIWLDIRGEIKSFGVDQIMSQEYYDENSEFEFLDRNISRHIFLPTGKNLKKGAGFYQNVWGAGSAFSYGITDQISIGGGANLISIFTGSLTCFIHPKFTKEIEEDINIGLGVYAGIVPEGGLVVPYGIMTYGNRDRNVTFGFGAGYGLESLLPSSVIGVNFRLHESLVFTSENIFVPVLSKNWSGEYAQDHIAVMALNGVKVVRGKNTFDFGIFLYFEDLHLELFAPYLGFARYF